MEKIKKTIEDIFYFVDSDIKVDFNLTEDVFSINIKMKEPQVLIGEKGQTLSEIERLLKIVIRKKIKEQLFINLDINDYKKRKADYLREIAIEAGEEVAKTGIEKKFPSMSAFERRVIHTSLSNRIDIITESVGEGDDRRVLIKKK